MAFTGRSGRLRPADARGFTIAELLIALALTGILMVTVYAAMDSQRNSYVAAEQISDIGQNLRVAVESVTREVRLAGLRTAGGQPAIVQAAPFQLIFYADVNQSCLCSAGGVRIAEDQCWGYPTSLGGGVDAAPADCRLKATNPMGDSPNDVSFYGTTVPAAPTTSPSHAELITWTFDRPSATAPGDAFPGFTITAASEAQVSNDCTTASINSADLDPQLSGTGFANPLYNLYRVVHMNRTSAVSTDNSASISKVASGLRGPCKSDNSTDSAELIDEVGNIWPAFSYWLDRNDDGEITNDCVSPLANTEDALYGDADGDCKFSAGEFAALTAVPQSSVAAAPANQEILENIIRVDVHLTGGAQDRARQGTTVGGTAVDFRARHLASSAAVRNQVR
ncbi:MAG: prepilin-type N-terminal cleavage/methylation domain-containing protein [bacterium]